MLGKMLFVGVGGSGGNTVRAIRELLLARLHAVGWEGKDLPKCWKTLWIDTISQQSRGGFPAKKLNDEDYYGLVRGQIAYETVKNDILQTFPPHKHNEMLSGWLPERSTVPVSKGAGQYRAIGRTVGVYQIRAMKDFLKRHMDDLSGNQSRQELDEVNNLFNITPDGKKSQTQVFVISSMAGGSGSGLFQDVAQIIKALNPQLDQFMHVLLYGADVFALSVPENMRRSVDANTLGALNETINGVWRSSVDQRTAEIFTSAGLPLVGSRYGGKHHWLIGAKNNEGALGSSTNEIYYAVGSSLASLATSPTTQVWLDEWVVTNVFPQSVDTEDKTRLKVQNNNDHYQPFAAMGFSRVSLGMTTFVEYAAESVTKESIQKLLWPDYEPISNDPSMNKNVQIDTRTEQLWSGFLTDTGLRERNPDNQVLDAFKGQDSFYTNFANECVTNAQGKDTSLDPSIWEQRIMSYFNANKAKLLKAEENDVFDSVKKWTDEIQSRILNATAGVIASGGLKVAIELLKKLRKELDFLIKNELPTDAQQRRNRTDEIRGRLTQLLATGRAKIDRKDQEIQKVQETIKKGVTWLSEVDRIMIAIEVLADLDENFLAPLIKSISDKGEELRVELKRDPAENEDLDFNSFPKLPQSDKERVQERFSPPETEQTLINYKEFPRLLREWSQSALDPSQASDWAIRLVQHATLGKAFDKAGDDEEQRMIRLSPNWQPKNSNYRSRSGNAQRAGFKVDIGVEEVFDRAKDMISDRAGALSRQVNMGIRPYLLEIDDAEAREKRQRDFVTKFGAALKYSQPMIEENEDVLKLIHPSTKNTKGTYTSFSTIPLENTDMEKLVRDRVIGQDPENPTINDPKTFNSSESIKEISIFCVTKEARNPVVFNSLMKPIQADWSARASSQSGRDSFWNQRQTKPLIEAIPVAEQVLKQMFLGWIALGYAGLRKPDESDLSKGVRISAYSYAKRQWVDFPHPLLSLRGDANSHENLPAVLTSIALALLKVNETATMEPLDAYHALIDAGINTDRTKPLGVNRILSDYITGNLPTGKSPDVADAQEMKRRLAEEVRAEIKKLEERFATADEKVDPFKMTRQYELKDIWLETLRTFLRLVENMSSTGSESGGSRSE